VLEFTGKVLHGDDLDLIDRVVSPDHIQHTPGIGQGREGLRRHILEVARKRPGRREWRRSIFSRRGIS
jgi:predicted SnoaL-like aldol condensation-catalyzing enzyme